MMQNIKKSLLLFTLSTTCSSFLNAGKLHNIIWKNDIKKVEQFFKNKKSNFIKIVEIVFKNNKTTLINVNERDRTNNDTPLRIASALGTIEIIQALLAHGADVNTPGSDDDTPIQAACGHGYKEIVQLLLSYGADVNKPNFYNDTPLGDVCCYKCFEIIKLLLSHGANINQVVGYSNKTPLDKIKEWPLQTQEMLLKTLLSIEQKKIETEQDTSTRLFIESNATNHANCFKHNKTCVPFILSEEKTSDLCSIKKFKEVKNKELIISIGEAVLNNLFSLFEKNERFTLPIFIVEQSMLPLHPYVKKLKTLRDSQEFKKRNIKNFNDLLYHINLLAFAQQCGKKWDKKQKGFVKFEDIALNFKNN